MLGRNDRIVVGILLSATVCALTFFASHAFFALFFALATLFVAWEAAAMLVNGGVLARLAFSLLPAALMFFSWHHDALHSGLIVFSFVWWSLMLVVISFYQPAFIKSRWFPWLFRLGLPFALAAFWLAVVELHKFSPQWFFYLISLVAIADIFAYLVGKRYGRRRLSSDISPGKTLEGLVGALLAGLSLSLIVAFYLYDSFPDIMFLALLSLFIVIIGVIGDLTESMVKRYSERKDSGSLLFGHGGVWDRLDSAIAAAPTFLFFIFLASGISI